LEDGKEWEDPSSKKKQAGNDDGFSTHDRRTTWLDAVIEANITIRETDDNDEDSRKKGSPAGEDSFREKRPMTPCHLL